MKRLELWVVLGILGLSAIIAYLFHDQGFRIDQPGAETYEVVNTWELPEVLTEVSGICFVADNQVAAIEDEDAIIFIYDLTSNKIVKKIKFGDFGDYEGLAINGKDAYVMRSDGILFEVVNYMTEPTVNEYKTPFTKKSNIESLTLDKAKNRLLFTPKDNDKSDDDFKDVFAFSLTNKSMGTEPVYKINMELKELEKYYRKKSYKNFRPSDLAVHPKTGDLYVLEGLDPKLLIVNSKGDFKDIYIFDDDIFPQPEGIAIRPDGKIYISNEGRGGSPNILEVVLN